MTEIGIALPQPWEGINGTARDSDDLLSLEEEAMPRRRRMVMMALLLRKATLVGNQAPVVRSMYERMSDPQPGDLVVETTTSWRPDGGYRGFGILLGHRREWCTKDEAWAAYLAENPDDDERLADHYWYIQYGPGERDISRWEDCRFIAVPDDPSAF